MVELVRVTLENEMDLVLVHKKALKVTEKIKLSLSTQATFATAMIELSRVVIEYTDSGILTIGLIKDSNRYSLNGEIRFINPEHSRINEDSYYYAKKLVPFFENRIEGNHTVLKVSINIPRANNLTSLQIGILKEYFESEPPISAYEEVKMRNFELSIMSEHKDEQLKMSKFLDEKRSEFISIASHELKTPITIIKAYAQIALSGKNECSDQVKNLLIKIDEQSSKLKNLVQQLLDTSKIENGNLEYQFEVVDINSYIEDSSFMIQHLLPKHKLVLEIGKNIQVRIDKQRLEQVISNLISNAAKYSKANSEVNMSTSINEEGNITIAIQDFGIGMSQSATSKIFEKFYRDEKVLHQYSGLGMGLFIASRIVNDHGGKIWVESMEGSGSTFFFTLPSVQN